MWAKDDSGQWVKDSIRAFDARRGAARVNRLRETDIRPDELMAEQARRYAADVAWLLERRDRFVEVAVPGLRRDRALARSGASTGSTTAAATSCGTVYVSPRPDPELLDEYYRSSTNYEYWNTVVFPASEDARRERIFRPRAERTVELAGARRGGGTLVDVGAGYGTFCEEVVRLGAFERVVALEPEPHLAETCRDKGLEVIEAPVEQAELESRRATSSRASRSSSTSSRRARFIERCAAILRAGRPGRPHVPERPRASTSRCSASASATVDAEHLNYLHPASLGAPARALRLRPSMEASDARAARRRAGAQEGAQRRGRARRAAVPAARAASTSGSASASRSRTSWSSTACRRTCGWSDGRADASARVGAVQRSRALARRSLAFRLSAARRCAG